MTEEQRQENNAQDTVNIAQALEFALLVLLLGEIKTTLESNENKAQSISNIRKGTEKAVSEYLPLLIASSYEVLKNNYNQTVKGFKGKKPSYKKPKDTEEYFKKYIKSKGTNFVVGKGQKLPQYFTTFIEREAKGVVDGTISINDSIDKAIRELSDSGLSVIDYDTGIKRNVDVFVRQQMLYAQKQSTQDLVDKYMEENDITIGEFDAHSNARPSHQRWQGKRFDKTGKYYPTLFELTHGEHKDYGCKHHYKAVEDKDDPPMYTEEELKILNTEPFDWKGRRYTGFEATQRQRAYERQIRALKRKIKLNESMGIDNTKTNVLLKKKNKEYRQFCNKFGTYPRNDRTKVI